MRHIRLVTEDQRPAGAASVPINSKDACVDILPSYLEKDCKATVKTGATYWYYIG